MSAPWDGGWEGLVQVGPETTNMIFSFLILHVQALLCFITANNVYSL